MPEPSTDDQDETITLPSGKKAVVPPPPGTSSPMYNADPSDGSGKDDATGDFLKRFDPSATKGLTDSLAGIERQRGAALDKSSGEINSRMAHDKAQMERAFGAEAASANSIPPMWDADKERKDRISDPIANFGSIGSIFGLIASAFTKTPMTSALNASAAAMNAIHQHDEEGYKSAYEAWKENTQLALKRFGMERELFEDTNKLIDTDINQWKVQTLAQAAQFDNKKVIAMLDAGMDDKVLEMQASQVRAAEGLVKAQEAFESYNTKKDQFASFARLNDEENPPSPKIPGATPQQQKEADQKYYKEHPGALPQYKALYRGYALQSVQEGGKPNPVLDAKMQAAAQGKVLSAEEEAKLTARAGSIMGSAEGALEENLFHKKIAEGKDPITARKEAISETVAAKVKAPDPDSLLDDDTADLMAEQYLAGQKDIFTNLGRGAQGAKNVIKVRNAIEKKAKDQGLKGPDIALRMAEYNGLVSGERALGTRTANVEMFAGEAYKMMDVARKASQDVPRGEWVPVNRALQAFEKNTGDPKIVAFGAAINTLVNTYAKAVSGGGQATMSDKDHARGMLEAAYSQAQFDAVLDTLGKELQAARAAPGMVKQGFRDLAGQNKLEGASGPVPNTIRYDADGNRIP